jgi:hypothetical protein
METNVRIRVHDGLDAPRIPQKHIRGAYGSDEVVHLTGDEQIYDVKTFNDCPVCASDPVSDDDLARKKYLDDNVPFAEVSASDNLRDSADNNNMVDDTGEMELNKEIKHNEVGGTIRVKFDLSQGNGAGVMHGQIYVNGIAVGTLRSNGGDVYPTYATYTEDIAVDQNDLVQLYVWYDQTGGGNYGYVRNFRLYYDKSVQATPGTVNQN